VHFHRHKAINRICPLAGVLPAVKNRAHAWRHAANTIPAQTARNPRGHNNASGNRGSGRPLCLCVFELRYHRMSRATLSMAFTLLTRANSFSISVDMGNKTGGKTGSEFGKKQN
jgi:hypothetical protein